MKLRHGKARAALLVATGLAVATTMMSLDGSASAEESPFSQDLGMLETAQASSIQPVTYNRLLADDEDAAGGQEEKTVAERFDAFSEKLDDLEGSIDDVAEVAGNKSIVLSGTSKSTMKVSGRIHADAWGFDIADNDKEQIARINEGLDPQNRLGFRRLRFGVKGKIKDNMEYKLEMEFAGGNKSEFRDAYLGWNNLSILQTVLLGNQKRPYGLDHLNSSRYNVFLERPFVIEANNQDARRLGLASYGVSEDLRWNWRYGVYNQRNVQGLGNYIDDHLQLEVTGRLANTIWYDNISGGLGYAHWAISGSHADADPNAEIANEARYYTRPEARSSKRWLNTGRIAEADFQNLLGLEGVLNVGPVQIVGEYQSVWVDRKAGLATTFFDGGYVYVSYFLTGEHMPWSRQSGTLARPKPFQNFWLIDRCDGSREAGWGAWQVAARYSYADYNDEDIFGGIGESFTFGLNWYWNPNARMQFNYIAGRIENRETEEEVGTPPNTSTITRIESGTYNIWGARFMVDF